LSHVRGEWKDQNVFVPKYRRKVMFGKLRAAIGRTLRDLCEQKGVEVLEGHGMTDQIYVCLKVLTKHAVSQTIGFNTGKTPVRHNCELLKERRMTGLHFWAVEYRMRRGFPGRISWFQQLSGTVHIDMPPIAGVFSCGAFD